MCVTERLPQQVTEHLSFFSEREHFVLKKTYDPYPSRYINPAEGFEIIIKKDDDLPEA